MGDVWVGVFSKESKKNIDNIAYYFFRSESIPWMDIEDAYVFH